MVVILEKFLGQTQSKINRHLKLLLLFVFNLQFHRLPMPTITILNDMAQIRKFEMKDVNETATSLDEQIAQLRQRFQLQYHALTEQYIVKNLNSGAQNTAPTLNTALYYLRDIDNIPLIDQQLLNPSQHYQVRLKVSMEFDSLPVPLKLSAYMSRSWWLGSDWFVWDL